MLYDQVYGRNTDNPDGHEEDVKNTMGMTRGWHGYKNVWHLLTYTTCVTCATERVLVAVPLHV